MKKIFKFFNNTGDAFYIILRVVAGLLFLQHGLQKLFGMFGGLDGAGAFAAAFTLFWFIGILELVAGLSFTLGIFVRPLALLASIEMIVAYIWMHSPNNIFPILNFGELPLLNFVIFLYLLSQGARSWSLEKVIFKKEFF